MKMEAQGKSTLTRSKKLYVGQQQLLYKSFLFRRQATFLRKDRIWQGEPGIAVKSKFIIFI